MNKSSNAEESSKKVVQHCETLKSLLEVLPLPCPPRNQILEILKTNGQLLSAFIEQQGHLNRQKGFSNQQKSTSYQSDVTDANTALTSAVSSFASQSSYDVLNDYSRILNAISKTDPQSGAAQAQTGSSTQLQSLSTDAARLPTPPCVKSAPWQASLPTDEADVVPPAPIISDVERQRVAAPDGSRGENSIKQMQTANLILSSGTGGGNMAVQVSFTSAVPVPVVVSPDKSQSQSHNQHPHLPPAPITSDVKRQRLETPSVSSRRDTEDASVNKMELFPRKLIPKLRRTISKKLKKIGPNEYEELIIDFSVKLLLSDGNDADTTKKLSAYLNQEATDFIQWLNKTKSKLIELITEISKFSTTPLLDEEESNENKQAESEPDRTENIREIVQSHSKRKMFHRALSSLDAVALATKKEKSTEQSVTQISKSCTDKCSISKKNSAPKRKNETELNLNEENENTKSIDELLRDIEILQNRLNFIAAFQYFKKDLDERKKSIDDLEDSDLRKILHYFAFERNKYAHPEFAIVPYIFKN
ncbi:uncharacterized protein LOC135845801 [Planococcus citri]|uniref:uncharacterized protein LOC135845801 n=1 Tax=Planococcus citri TaxID=170843 RepID=UPI0031F881F2